MALMCRFAVGVYQHIGHERRLWRAGGVVVRHENPSTLRGDDYAVAGLAPAVAGSPTQNRIWCVGSYSLPDRALGYARQFGGAVGCFSV